MKIPRVLSIAGSDPVAGAGIQADLKTFSALGVYGTTAITALVDENTLEVKGVYPMSVSCIQGQIRSILEDVGTDAIKVGMLFTSDVIEGVQEMLEYFPAPHIVLDPVMVATTGGNLLKQDAVEALEKLIPLAQVITPNLPEAEILLNQTINSQKELPRVAKELAKKWGYSVSVLLKAGHLKEEEVIDVFYNAEQDQLIELASPRIRTNNTHGTGCSLSSAIAAYLARGEELNEAIRKAKWYIAGAIEAGKYRSIGKGKGPIDHFWHSLKEVK